MGTHTVLLGSIQQETNTFNERPTERGDFQARREYFGDEIVDELDGTRTYVGGVLDGAKAAGVDLIPTVAAAAQTGGRARREVFDFYVDHIVDAARERADELDGVVLALHGALVPEGLDDGEGHLISSVREVVGSDVPITVSLDLHALTSAEMVSSADALVMCNNYPHDDQHIAGRTAMEILLETAQGDIDPVTHLERVPMVLHVPKMVTYRGPMATISERARELEDEHDAVRTVNVNPTHNTADVPFAGFTVSTVTDGDPDLARGCSRDVAAMAWKMREEFYGEYPSPSDAVAEAIERAADRDEDDSPVLLVEAGDVVGGGSPGDVTAVLREMIDAGVDDAGFASVWDPESVRHCIESGVGNRTEIPALGGKAVDGLSEPLEDLDAHVKAVTDGEFVNTGPMATGSRNHLGPTVLIQCGPDDGVEVIVTSNRQQPIDAEIWRHIGIQPERKSVLAIKSVNHFRADYERFIDPEDILTVDGPGLTPIDTLRMLDFQRLRRPIYPLDENATYDPS